MAHRGRTLLLVLTCLLPACAMGDIFGPPLPVDVTEQQVIGTWTATEGAGTFVFAADGTLAARDLPADVLPASEASGAAGPWSCTGTWRITSPIGGDEDQRNIVELDLRGVPGTSGGYSTRMSASKPDDVIVLGMDRYSYRKRS
ncbi:hypothetical protein OHA72_41305 [Dactylosporangium sp. NBC_01737]|uniref:hypothetical protein n=1 Tax=Dactylosporangium sp. NBC_01737 TaxID=2975959 RepID=UPI002E12B2DD|nr:hypothetical protein OHA72_41305 [Dactylosporangium sp. NBC_01737]